MTGPSAATDVHEQVRAMLALQRDHAAATEMLNAIESVRAQLQSLRAQANADAAVRDAGAALEQKFMDVEGRLVDLRLTGRGQDEVRYPVRLGGQLSYVANGIDDSDFAPTTQQREVAGLLAKETRDVQSALQALMSRDLADYNSQLRSRGLKTIDAPAIVF